MLFRERLGEAAERAPEVQIYNAQGELISRAVRTYGADGRVAEEHQILDKLETLIPAEHRAKLMQESDLSADELMQELRAQLTKLMSGQPGPYSVSYRYDAQGHLIHTSRRIFSHQEEIETTHNPYGDIESEIERRTLPPDSSSFSEARDGRKATLHRSNPEAQF